MEKIVSAIGASEGIAIGSVVVLEEEGEFCPIKKDIAKEDLKKEVARYKDALSETKKEMEQLKERLGKMMGKEYSRLADAYKQILDDPLLIHDVPRQIYEGTNAEYALYLVLDKVIKSFSRLDDPYFKDRKNDIQDIGSKILGHLMGRERKSLSTIDKNSIVVAKNLTPNDTIFIRERNILGFVTEVGGKTSHVAILAKALEIPAVVGATGIRSVVKTGDIAIVDGTNGKVLINPDEEVLVNYRREKERFLALKKEFEKLRDLPAQTVDGKRIELAANFDNLTELPLVLNNGAEGIGLFRTEYLYLNRNDLPSEEELYASYSYVSKKMLPYGVIIRTLDLGGDKIPESSISARECPSFLGLRAIRLCLKFPQIFKPQLRAILRAGAVGKVKIMFPMISCVEEFLAAKKILEECKIELKKEGVPFDNDIAVGAMIEVPSAAMSCDFIAKEADFLSVGTNDLIQYAMAVDRTDETVADLYNPSHIGVLRLLKHIVDAGHAAGIWVGMCGDMATDPEYTALLVGLGFDELSVPVCAIGKIKKVIRSVSALEMSKKVEQILKGDNIATIKKELKRITT